MINYGVYHGVAPFDYREGIKRQESSVMSWSEVVARQIEKWTHIDEDIVTIRVRGMAKANLEYIVDLAAR